jgi:hypothetical protein
MQNLCSDRQDVLHILHCLVPPSQSFCHRADFVKNYAYCMSYYLLGCVLVVLTAELIRSVVERTQRLVQQRFCAAIVHVLSGFLDSSIRFVSDPGGRIIKQYSVLVRQRI